MRFDFVEIGTVARLLALSIISVSVLKNIDGLQNSYLCKVQLLHRCVSRFLYLDSRGCKRIGRLFSKYN